MEFVEMTLNAITLRYMDFLHSTLNYMDKEERQDQENLQNVAAAATCSFLPLFGSPESCNLLNAMQQNSNPRAPLMPYQAIIELQTDVGLHSSKGFHTDAGQQSSVEFFSDSVQAKAQAKGKGKEYTKFQTPARKCIQSPWVSTKQATKQKKELQPAQNLVIPSQPIECSFCKSNGELPSFYRSHKLKDENKRVLCPVLRMYKCPICKLQGGDRAHTIKYCPVNKFSGVISTSSILKTERTSTSKRRL